MDTNGYIIIAIGFLSLIVIELLVARERKQNLHDAKDSLVSATLGITGILTRLMLVPPTILLYEWIRTHMAPWQLGDGFWIWFLCFWGNEFIYYWFHRWSHEIRFLWATHVNHHSSEYMNFFTASRTPFMNAIYHVVFWIPLALAGIPAEIILQVESIGFLIAFLQHTEIIPKLGPLEWFLNTPSHHRVHHGSNPQYVDKNYGGVVIVFDRLFGTFEPEQEKVVYGITKNIRTYRLDKVIFHEWVQMIRDMASARRMRDRLRFFFGRVGWSPDKENKTA